jgi:hypothetical protein
MNNIDKMYMDRFIKSMTEDFKKWKMLVFHGMDGSIVEFRSPKYGKNVVFGFESGMQGVWINDNYSWSVPKSVLLSPFNKYFWSYRGAKRKLRKYLTSERTAAYNKKLFKTIKNIDD